MFPFEAGRAGWFPQVRVIELVADLACGSTSDILGGASRGVEEMGVRREK